MRQLEERGRDRDDLRQFKLASKIEKDRGLRDKDNEGAMEIGGEKDGRRQCKTVHREEWMMSEGGRSVTGWHSEIMKGESINNGTGLWRGGVE